MNVTKRKFNALLSGIGNKSTTSLSSQKNVNNTSRVDLTSTEDMDRTSSMSKKRRTSPSTPMDSPTFSAVKTLATKLSAAASMPHRKSASTATATLEAETPKYAPWDRGEFLKRLKSFSSITDWTPKPARVNEVEWAKRGWVCQKTERVRCCLCNVEILVKLNQKVVDGKEEPVYIEDNIEDALVNKYTELIITSHNEDCLWRQRGCDDSIFKLPLTHAPTTLKGLRERYDELLNRKGNLPYLSNIRTPPGFDYDRVVIYLPKNFFASPSQEASENSSNPLVNKVAFVMALFGWQGYAHERLGDHRDSASCQACFRNLGLWLFKSKEVNSAGEEIVGARMSHLDAVEEHRDYCPWRNAASQNGLKAIAKSGSSATPGWEVVVRVLKNDYYLRAGKDSKESVAQYSGPTADNASDIDSLLDDPEDSKIREDKDKERWTRLRRVKSLFDTKNKRKSAASVKEKAK